MLSPFKPAFRNLDTQAVVGRSRVAGPQFCERNRQTVIMALHPGVPPEAFFFVIHGGRLGDRFDHSRFAANVERDPIVADWEASGDCNSISRMEPRRFAVGLNDAAD